MVIKEMPQGNAGCGTVLIQPGCHLFHLPYGFLFFLALFSERRAYVSFKGVVEHGTPFQSFEVIEKDMFPCQGKAFSLPASSTKYLNRYIMAGLVYCMSSHVSMIRRLSSKC